MQRRCIHCKTVIEAEDAVMMVKEPYGQDKHPFCPGCSQRNDLSIVERV